MVFRRLGIGPGKSGYEQVWASQVLDVLGAASFAGFGVTRYPGSVIWCNFDLARQLGFKVPRANQLTPRFHRQLLSALSLRVPAPADKPSAGEIVTLYADRYGGDGLGPALGAGRAGFLEFGNLYIKGVGLSPLFRHNDPSDFVHSHGGVHLEDCVSEAIFGEVNENLFTQGSCRVLAIIDQGMYVTEPSGRQRHIALAVRAGAQLRPGHLLGRSGRGSRSLIERFISITRAATQVVNWRNESTGDDLPDVAASMLRVIDDHARTAAEGFRWRIIHGAISSSNMEMSGAMLDLPTQSAQPRTAPVWKLDYADSVYGTEHMDRAFQLAQVYRRILRSTRPALRQRFNAKWINIPAEMQKAYRRHLEINLLRAAGLKPEVAGELQIDHRELTGRFTDLVLKMSVLKNAGNVSVTKSVVAEVSVLDVFNLLGNFPRAYFADPNAPHRADIRKLLRPVFKGNRFHIQKRKAAVRLLVDEFANLYPELMNVCGEYTTEYYGGVKGMQASITARAAFENQPLDALYCQPLYRDISRAIVACKSSGNAAIIRNMIDRRIAVSLRNVNALLAQGESRRLLDNGIELEMRTIDGIRYSVRAWYDEEQTRRLHVSIPVVREGEHYSSLGPNPGRLTPRQIRMVRYRFTTDGWKSFSEISAQLTRDSHAGMVIQFEDICSFPLVGTLQGYCYLAKPNELAPGNPKRGRGGYAFAIPDKQELIGMVTGPRQGSGK